MIVNFSAGNFLSFRDRKTLSFEAGSISELPENVVKQGRYKLLRSAVVYGANSSGKSNLIKALDRMRDLLLLSVKLNITDELPFSPFILTDQDESTPTYFEIEFITEQKIFRYGFEYNRIEIVNEWLFFRKLTSVTEKILFARTKNGIAVSNEFEEGIGKENSTNSNRLFVSLVAQLNGPISKSILLWFANYNVLSGIDHKDYTGYTVKMLHEKLLGSEMLLPLFLKLKLGFQNLELKHTHFGLEEIPKSLPENLRVKLINDFHNKSLVSLQTVHQKFNSEGEVIGKIAVEFDSFESEGTKKIIDLSGPVFDTLLKGKIIIIDELDAKLHPLLTIQLIRLFHDPELNRSNAQLFFATHDTNLLSSDLFRRDQIWFTEKDETEQTDLYSLNDFKLPDGSKVRNDGNYERNYIKGRYGAIPFITYTE
jgi:AAA15 family ATPase/GTPase